MFDLRRHGPKRQAEVPVTLRLQLVPVPSEARLWYLVFEQARQCPCGARPAALVRRKVKAVQARRRGILHTLLERCEHHVQLGDEPCVGG